MAENTEKLGYTIALGLNYGVVALEPGDIQQFYFIEDIFSFCMVGKMIFEDRFGFVEYGPFTGNERLLLAYGEQKSRRLLFDIIKIEKMTMSSPTLSTTGTQIVIYFVDTTYKYFTKRRFSKSWSDEPISDIMDHILQKMCTGGDNEQILLKRRDPSDTKVDFIMPYWTPMESISWLNKRTKPNSPQNVGNDIGGYLYYNNTHWDDSESKNKDNNFTAAWKSINGLFSYPITREDEWIDWENPFVFSGGPPGSTDDAPTYVNKILDWRYGGIDFTNIKKIQGGHMLGYNFDGKELIDRTYKYYKNGDTKTNIGMIDTITGLGKKSLFPDISERDSEMVLSGADNEDELDNIYYHDWLRNYSKQQVLSVIVRGWEERFAGMMIKDVIWESFENSNLGGNRNMIGPYVIKSVTHNFGTKQGYTQRLVLLKNAYYKSDASLVELTETNTATTGILG